MSTINSTHQLDRPWTKGEDRVDLEGSFKFNGSSATTFLRGKGFLSVTYVTTGTYLVTLDDGYIDVDAAWAAISFSTAAAAANIAVYTSFPTASSGTWTFNIFVMSSGSLNDPTPATGAIISMGIRAASRGTAVTV